MKITIQNLSPHPMDIHGIEGRRVLHAFGALEIEVTPDYAEALRQSPLLTIEVAGRMLDTLEQEYKQITGKAPDKRWSTIRLTQEINQLKATA